jgi:hypothetical protein
MSPPRGVSADDLVPQVPPIRVERHDQVDLPLPRPALDVLLTLDGCADAVVALVVDKVLDAVALREPGTAPFRCSKMRLTRPMDRRVKPGDDGEGGPPSISGEEVIALCAAASTPPPIVSPRHELHAFLRDAHRTLAFASFGSCCSTSPPRCSRAGAKGQRIPADGGREGVRVRRSPRHGERRSPTRFRTGDQGFLIHRRIALPRST